MTFGFFARLLPSGRSKRFQCIVHKVRINVTYKSLAGAFGEGGHGLAVIASRCARRLSEVLAFLRVIEARDLRFQETCTTSTRTTIRVASPMRRIHALLLPPRSFSGVRWWGWPLVIFILRARSSRFSTAVSMTITTSVYTSVSSGPSVVVIISSVIIPSSVPVPFLIPLSR